MSELNVASSSAQRADELFRQHQHQIYCQTDRLLARLMIVQWLAGVLAAFVITPTTWNGEVSAVHVHVWASIFLGGLITLFPVWLTYAWPGALITRHVIAAAQMLMSALLISLTGGRIETHFHVFGSLVILSFYRDWRVLIPATVVVGLDHFLRGVYWPYSVYGILVASPWRSVEHAGWVVFEDIFLVISCLRSITEMRSIATRRTELEASERNFREIFEEAPIGIAVVGLDEKLRQVNPTFSKMLGYSKEELCARTPLDVTHPDDVALSRELAQAMLNSPESHHMEKRYQRKNGDVVWVKRTGCVIRDASDAPRQFLIMVEDISDRKHAEDELRRSKHELEIASQANQLIMDNSQDVICTIAEHGRFLSINAACQDLWDYSADDLIGAAYVDLVHVEDRNKTAEAFANARKAGKLTDFVDRCVRKDGAIVDVLWSASWSEMDRIFFCVAHDVTQRQRAEAALREAKETADRANRAKSEFLSRMSHELRTPLNAILGFSQLLERQSPTETQRSRLSHITSAGRHLLDLINEVLDISRIEAGRIQLSVEPVGIADVLNETLDLIRPLAAERAIDLSAPDKIDNDWHMLADRQRLKQVLLNLLSNAVKYTPTRGRVAVSADLLGENMIRLAVSDNGVGIARENLSRLFTPFDRLGAEQSEVQGTGLGLALSQRLMQAMGGSIGVESDLGHGSTFWIDLPRAVSPVRRANSSVAKTPGELEKQLPNGHKRTVLYIEDNASNLSLIEQIVALQGDIELITAIQGRRGVDLAKRHAPDLILLDLHLPDMPGWQVLAELQADESTRNIPAIVISADATPRQTERLVEAGARAYLTKPLDVDHFIRTCNEMARPKPVATSVS
jgi:two-component system, sensor histidine kinase and response regulator